MYYYTATQATAIVKTTAATEATTANAAAASTTKGTIQKNNKGLNSIIF